MGNGRCEFTLWAPFLKSAAVRAVSPDKRIVPMHRDRWDYWRITLDSVFPGTLYFYRLDEALDRPDPASSSQPEGVHGPSRVVDHSVFRWKDKEWSGLTLEKMIIYELHVGTFTPEGTFEDIIPRLEDLCDLGINALELMPVAQFPGERNWGYDGAYPFAVHNSYGGPEGLKKLVDACHRRGMAVILDVVYNHIGPEGNYFDNFGPYFTDKYRSLWGGVINFDEACSDDVRNFFIENALHWFGNYHIDVLRLDAVHGIYDMGAKHFLQELAERTGEFSERHGRKYYLVAEGCLDDTRYVRPGELGGYSIDAMWCDDFHHSVHALLAGETTGYNLDFGRIGHLVKAFNEGFVYSWQYSSNRKKHIGSSSRDIPAHQFIVFTQNHDVTGNRMLGERLSKLVSFEALKLSAGAVLLSPYIPLLFMGEEYGEESPFLYFISHSDPDLAAAVRKGRKEDFREFKWHGEPPDPQSTETFYRSKLRWDKRKEGRHRTLLGFYKRLIQLRGEIPALSNLDKRSLNISGMEDDRLIFLRRWHHESQVFCAMNFNSKDMILHTDLPEGEWKKRMDSSEEVWEGPGSYMPPSIESGQELIIRPLSFVLYIREPI